MMTWRSVILLLTLVTGCVGAPEEALPEEELSAEPVPLASRKKPCVPSASLLSDIRPGAMGSRPRELIIVRGELFFTAEDGTSGRELWKSSGTHGAGTVRVKDVRPGPATSNPRRLTEVGDKLFFTAEDGKHGRELWVSDGTDEGTVMVKDIFPGSLGSAPEYLTAFEGILYFAANDGVNGTELWRSDGTAEGTFLVEDLSGSSNPRRLIRAGDALYFVAQVGSTQHLWRSTGVPGATSVFSAPPNAFLFSFTAAGPDLFFLVDDGEGQVRLWWTRNAAASPLRSFSGHAPHDLVAVGRRIFFSAGGGEEGPQGALDGEELWVSDGTTAGTVKVRDIQPGAQGSLPSSLAEVNGRVFFSAEDEAQGRELWLSDGTAKGTALVRELEPGTGGSLPQALTAVSGRLFFSAETSGRGRELWMSDGTAAGTVPLEELAPGSASSNPTGFIRSGAEVYFTATNAAHGEELWTLPLHSGRGCHELSAGDGGRGGEAYSQE
jgi:ELWxxDGT repeat protein